ncbi:hypothetical protein PENNAL_c0022G11597 [Penicillium nalgiovense]|uniref:Uncharacterized protein n=1 Tax=Penicillium nalgiovense TaxID=60175 RepID=A0A1V6YF43_PENNA|nr:hypothetical protein PENNAL_c0022G11597 [Penicillium nalgiovense]
MALANFRMLRNGVRLIEDGDEYMLRRILALLLQVPGFQLIRTDNLVLTYGEDVSKVGNLRFGETGPMKLPDAHSFLGGIKGKTATSRQFSLSGSLVRSTSHTGSARHSGHKRPATQLTPAIRHPVSHSEWTLDGRV